MLGNDKRMFPLEMRRLLIAVACAAIFGCEQRGLETEFPVASSQKMG